MASLPTELADYDVYVIDLNLTCERTPMAISKIFLDELHKWEANKNAFQKKTIILVDSFEVTKNITETLLVDIFKAIVNRHRDYLMFVFSVDKVVTGGNPIWGTSIYMTPLIGVDFDWYYKGLGGLSKFKNIIFTVTGGYPALVKRLCEVVEAGGDVGMVIENPRLNPHVLYQLELMKEELAGSKNYFDVPLYNTFLNGASFGHDLTKLENKAIKFLGKSRGQIIDREDLIHAIWGEHATTEVSDHALDQLIHRLKIKVAKEGIKIETIKGRGHRMG